MSYGSLRRIYKIDRLIRQGRFVSAQAAADEFEVTKRTIERDLEVLRLDLGAELVYKRGKKRYEYKGDPVTLPGMWLNEREIAILLIAERALRMFANTSFHKEIHPVFNKLLDPIRDDKHTMTFVADLCNSVHFHRPVDTAQDLSVEFSVVLEGIMQRRRISLEYHPADSGTGDLCELEPYAMVNDVGSWHVVGVCLQTRQMRTFALAGIRNPKLTDHRFDRPRDFSVERYLHEGFSKAEEGKPERIQLKISAFASEWMGRSVWDPSQKVSKRVDGTYILEMSCPITDSLVRWVLQMGEHVVVAKPQKLRDMLMEKARKLIANHRKGMDDSP